jgi:hypothetical protein
VRQRADQAGALRDGDEVVGRHQPTHRVHPSHQRLERPHLTRVGVDLRLIVQDQFIGRDRAAKFSDQAQPLRVELVDAGVVADDRGPGSLRRVERQVGVAQQRLGALRVDRPHRIAHARFGRDRDARQFRLVPECVLDPPQYAFHRLRLRAGEHDAELVAAEPGDGVAGPQCRFQAFRHDAEELVAVAVAERVVDFFEPVEVHHHERHLGAESPRRRERSGHAVGVQRPVGEAGQRVVHGHVLRALALTTNAAGHRRDDDGEHEPQRGQPDDHGEAEVVQRLGALRGDGLIGHVDLDDTDDEAGLAARMHREEGLDRGDPTGSATVGVVGADRGQHRQRPFGGRFTNLWFHDRGPRRSVRLCSVEHDAPVDGKHAECEHPAGGEEAAGGASKGSALVRRQPQRQRLAAQERFDTRLCDRLRLQLPVTQRHLVELVGVGVRDHHAEPHDGHQGRGRVRHEAPHSPPKVPVHTERVSAGSGPS